MVDLTEKISKARGEVISVASYLARGLFRMRWVEDNTVPTAGITPSFRVRYNAQHVEKKTHLELAGLIVHELGHCLGFHHSRMGDRTAVCTNGTLLWNYAADVTDNDFVESLGLPPTQVTRAFCQVPEHIQMTEEVYDWMLSQAQELPPGEGSEEGDLLPLGEGEEMEGDEGIVAKQVAADVQEYARRHPGKVPSSLEMWADSVLERPRIRWQDVIRSQRTREVAAWVAGSESPTFGRRSRRQDSVGGGEFVLPGRIRQVPLTVVIVDMSGSMADGKTGCAVLTSVGGIIDASGGQTIAITCDTAAQVLGPIASAREIVAKGRHGGGTDMTPAFEEARKMRAACVVCITDGYLPPVPDRAIWLITPGGERQDWMRGTVLHYD